MPKRQTETRKSLKNDAFDWGGTSHHRPAIITNCRYRTRALNFEFGRCS